MSETIEDRVWDLVGDEEDEPELAGEWGSVVLALEDPELQEYHIRLYKERGVKEAMRVIERDLDEQGLPPPPELRRSESAPAEPVTVPAEPVTVPAEPVTVPAEPVIRPVAEPAERPPKVPAERPPKVPAAHAKVHPAEEK